VGRSKPSVVVVFDVGKTHVKLLAIASEGGVVEAVQTGNRPIEGPPYLHVDVEAIFSWLTEALADLAARFDVLAIVPCAYGSTAALVDEHGLVLPMMDYEAEPPEDIVEGYAAAAPDFDEVGCPINPGGLTLARQLFWQSRHFPERFEKARWLLPAAQYWGWRLTGVLASEVTSLGAQTQLWNPRTNQPSSLALREGWSRKLPPLRKAWDTLGPLNQALTPSQGRGASPPVLVGLHDSNANYIRYLAAGFERFTLISSGTWLITFDQDLPLDRLDPVRDMVSNTDLEGRPVACTRFMGGREFLALAGEELDWTSTPDDVAGLIARGTMALPSFTDSGGPFPGTGRHGRIVGLEPQSPAERTALASLYVALMTAVDLDLLGSSGDVIIDGSFAENHLFAGLLAALRPKQSLSISKARDGTALGAALLWNWPRHMALDLEKVTPIKFAGLDAYAGAWRRHAEALSHRGQG
jgi:sugar (pentulose or hexulose) kinase